MTGHYFTYANELAALNSSNFAWNVGVIFNVSSNSPLSHVKLLSFMYSWKRSPQYCVIKLRDNRMFQAFLWIKKSFKSIDIDLAKHALVSPLTHRCTGYVNFD